MGVVYLKRKSFYYLIEPFALGGGSGLLFGSFASKCYRLKAAKGYKGLFFGCKKNKTGL
jgi:hypothetical protein